MEQLDVVASDAIRKAHESGGPSSDVAPPVLSGHWSDTRIVDVAGSWINAVSGTYHFDEVVQSLPLGPVFVTLRFEPNEANKYGIAAYVRGRQVGYLATEWSARDRWVVWIRKLDAAKVLPRFRGVVRTQPSGDRIINFEVPGRDDESLTAIAKRILTR